MIALKDKSDYGPARYVWTERRTRKSLGHGATIIARFNAIPAEKIRCRRLDT